MASDHIHFVTGRLAEHSLRKTVESLAHEVGFDYSIDVLPITVAALMTPEWIAKRIKAPAGTTRVLVPGYCSDDLVPVQNVVRVPVDRGPRDLRELPRFFGRAPMPTDYGTYDIEIIAEINHCPRLSLSEILAQAKQLADDGADLIDVGCEPGGPWAGVADVVLALRDSGHHVSIDSLDPREIEPAVRAGAELVLSVNSSNREAARDWGCEVVVVPDDPRSLAGLDETIESLAANGIRLRIDPVLEPIGFGFAQSLGRYLQVRERYPDAEMMMGIGNLTELTDADSAAINVVLLGFCEELGIRSVLTTQVINWAQSSVRECDLARRLVHHSIRHRVLPKHLEPRLVMLRDPAAIESPAEDLDRLAREIKDANYRVFVSGSEVHVVSHELHLHDADPFLLFDHLRQSGPDGGLPKNLDAAHSFYLGYEMCKAATANALGKQYQQDESLDWGFLSRGTTTLFAGTAESFGGVVTTLRNDHDSLPLVERLDPSLTAVDAFRRLSGLPHVVFFDSAMRHPQLGRYSFVAADPVEWLIVSADGTDAFQQLAGRVAILPPTSRADLPPFQGGWAGLFGYELAGSLERVPKPLNDEFKIPALAVGLYDVVVAFDDLEGAAWLISQGIPEIDEVACRKRAADRMAQFRRQLLTGEFAYVDVNHSDYPRLSTQNLAPQFIVDGHLGLTSNFSADDYRRAVQHIIDYILAGDVFQVNLSQRLLHAAVSSSIDLYCRLRDRNPAPFASYLNGGEWQIASASPERFIRVENGHVETRPIKGTRGRSQYPVADMFTGDVLRASEKDRAENVMIVDLLRNDLSRTCRPESVRVSQLCGLETYEYVQHLVSVVEGSLRPECTPLDVLRTSFPGGSVTGAPKIRAMEIIAELEPTVRGPYCGSLGYIGVGGQMDTSILIRTITSARGWWQLPVGGGIVAKSTPQSEYDETWHKAAGLIRALEP